MLIIGKHIKIIIDDLFQRLDHGKQFLTHGYFSAWIFCFGSADDKFRVLFLPLNEIDTFDSAADRYSAVGDINVTPFQGAYLTDSQTGTKTYIDAKSRECKMALDMV